MPKRDLVLIISCDRKKYVGLQKTLYFLINMKNFQPNHAKISEKVQQKTLRRYLKKTNQLINLFCLNHRCTNHFYEAEK